MNHLPIGVFDSGVGGLTVLKALQKQLPDESFLYLGDMARLPYGTKEADTVTKYSLQVCTELVEQGVKMLVVACNTASALALPSLQQHFPDLPIVGVLAPGARSAVDTTKNGHIAVIATESTVKSNSYSEAISQLRQDATITSKGCNLLVALVEEGWTNGEITQSIIRQYLDPLMTDSIDTLVLGCTHFPALSDLIQASIPRHVKIVNSADATANVVKQTLTMSNLHCGDQNKNPVSRFLVTDSPERFSHISRYLLPYEIEENQIELIDLNGYHVQARAK